MTAADRQKSSPPRPRRLRASFSSSCKRLGLAAACLLVLSSCGESEPQLACGEIYQKLYQVGRQLERDDLEIMDLTSQIQKRAEMCARARTWVQQQKAMLKLIRDNKDRCKEFDFSLPNLPISLATPGISGTMAESEVCK